MNALAGAEPLIEREGPLRTLAQALGRAAEGHGGIVLIEGEAGIGKSRLCAEAEGLSEEYGMGLLTACGGQLERDLPYGVARQLLERRLLRATAAERRRLTAGPARLALAAIGDAVDELVFSPDTGLDHGLYWLVSNLAAMRPIAIVVDDAHWADPATMRFLLYLGRRLSGLRVAVVLAARPRSPGSESRLLDLVGSEPTTTVLELSPLSESGAASLLGARLSARPPEEVVRACHDVTGGNPFFLSEIAAAVVDAERPTVEEVRSLLPAAVTRSIVLRLGHEAPPVRATAAALAVAGDEASIDLLASIAGLNVDAVPPALGALTNAGITARSGRIAFVHPIIRSAVYDDIPAARRGELHRAAAAALVRRGRPVETVAQHLLLTDPAGEPAAATSLRRAGERALSRGALDTAVQLLSRAASEPPADDERAEVLVTLGEAELRAGMATSAVEHLRQARALELSGTLRVRATIALASAVIAVSSPAEAFSLLGDHRHVSAEEALRLDVERATLAAWVRGARALPWLEELLTRFARLPGATPVERLALSQAALATAYEPSASAAAAARLARRALSSGKLIEEQSVDGIAPGMAIYVLVMADDLAAAESELKRMQADAAARGSLLGFAGAGLLTGQLALKRGELKRAAAQFDAAREAALGLLSSPVAQRCVAFTEAWLVESQLALGNPAGARETVARAAAIGHFEQAEMIWSRYGRALVRLDDGDAAGAVEDLMAFGEAARAGGYEDRQAPWRQWAALALAAAGDRPAALALADEQLRIASAWSPGAHGAALRVMALVGDPDQVEPCLARATELLIDTPLRLDHARALVDWGFALRRAQQRSRARTVLESGLELAARCGAGPLIERARTELIALGARPRRLMFSGVEALTATERRVADLAAQGLSNRAIARSQFVTEKTVESHLRSVYRKLDLSSRGQLKATLDAG